MCQTVTNVREATAARAIGAGQSPPLFEKWNILAHSTVIAAKAKIARVFVQPVLEESKSLDSCLVWLLSGDIPQLAYSFVPQNVISVLT